MKVQELRRDGRLQEAVIACRRVLREARRDAEVNYFMAALEAQAGDLINAIKHFEAALAITPDFPEARFNLAGALTRLGRHEDAIPHYAQIVSEAPQNLAARQNYAACLKEAGRHLDALDCYDEIIRLIPNSAQAHVDRGVMLETLRRFSDALSSYDRALAIKPDYAEAHASKGVTFQKLGRLEEALARYDRAIALKPDFVEAHIHRASALRDVQRYEEAAASYAKAFALAPDHDFLAGAHAHAMMLVCDWRRFDALRQGLKESVEAGRAASDPFAFLGLQGSSALQARVARRFVEARCPDRSARDPIRPRPPHGRIKLGYFSADLHNHATAYLMAELIERHDRTRFEVIAFSLGPDVDDLMRRRLRLAFDQFHDLRYRSDHDIVRFARNLEIDIAIDLNGFRAEGRPQVFARRCAPVQVNYLGFPGTMGAPYMDYIVTDRVLTPVESWPHFDERVVWLPGSYQANSRRSISRRIFTRAELGLPAEGFVFCCFNRNDRITPTTFESWMRILSQVEGSVLWLQDDGPAAAANLRKEAAARGVDGARLIFAGRMDPPDHLARHRLAGLFLDTLPYNAHAGASDALWSGLPVLTLIGEAFPGRVAASLLTAVGLPELIMTRVEDYEALAIRLATRPAEVSALNKRLADLRLTSGLFDARLFAGHIEAAYVAMHERRLAGLAPDHIEIAP